MHTSSACRFSSIKARSSSRSFRTLDLAESTRRASASSLSCSAVIRALSSSAPSGTSYTDDQRRPHVILLNKNLPLNWGEVIVRYESPLQPTLVEHGGRLLPSALVRLRHQSVPVVVARLRISACNWPSPSLLQAQPH